MSAPTPAEFVATCGRRGIRLRVVGDKIKATGNPPANPEAFAAYLKAQKPELVEILTGNVFAVARTPAQEAQGGQTTPPNAQRGLLAPPDAKQGIPAGVEGWDEAPEVAVAMRRRIRAAVDQARAGTFPELGPVELGSGRTVSNPPVWLLAAVKRLRRAVDALQQTRFGTPAYAERWHIAAEIVADMETVADLVHQAHTAAAPLPPGGGTSPTPTPSSTPPVPPDAPQGESLKP